MAVEFGYPCQYTGFIPYDYPPGFNREWSIESRLAGLKEIYGQKIRAGSKEKFPDVWGLERKTYLRSRFEEFRDSVISAIRRSGLENREKIEAEDKVGELYEKFLKGLGFIDESGNLAPSFEVLPEDYDYAGISERSAPMETPEEIYLETPCLIYQGIDGNFRKGFLMEESCLVYS